MLLEIKRQIQQVCSLLWSLGAKTDYANANYHHLLALTSFHCGVGAPQTRRPFAWGSAHRSCGKKSLSREPFCSSVPCFLRTSRSCCEGFWLRAALEDSPESYNLVFKEVNQRDLCRHCKGTCHSVMFCKQPQHSYLLCQLCLLGPHWTTRCPAHYVGTAPHQVHLAGHRESSGGREGQGQEPLSC
jgi:hypothetical protein